MTKRPDMAPAWRPSARPYMARPGDIPPGAKFEVLGTYAPGGGRIPDHVPIAEPAGQRVCYRWADAPSIPMVGFASVEDALAAAAFASGLPAGLDTLHLVTWPGGVVEVVAAALDAAHWLRPR